MYQQVVLIRNGNVVFAYNRHIVRSEIYIIIIIIYYIIYIIYYNYIIIILYYTSNYV